MRVRVIKSSKDTYWYRNCVGMIFDCVDKNPLYPNDHRVIRDKNIETYGFILADDAEILSDNAFSTLTEIVKQLEFCNYRSTGGLLVNDIAFISLKEMAKKEQHG